MLNGFSTLGFPFECVLISLVQPCPPEACDLVAAGSYFSHTNKKCVIAINSSSGTYRACFEFYGDFNLACRQNVPGEMTQRRKRGQKLPMCQPRV